MVLFISSKEVAIRPIISVSLEFPILSVSVSFIIELELTPDTGVFPSTGVITELGTLLGVEYDGGGVFRFIPTFVDSKPELEPPLFFLV